MTEVEHRYQRMVVQGWSGMLVLLWTMFINDLVEYAMRGEYHELSALLSSDPGAFGLQVLTGLICFNVVAQMAIRAAHRRGCRWRVFGVTVAYVAFFVVHQAAHLAQGDGFNLHFMLDATRHVIGLWACWAAWRWARLARDEAPITTLAAHA